MQQLRRGAACGFLFLVGSVTAFALGTFPTFSENTEQFAADNVKGPVGYQEDSGSTTSSSVSATYGSWLGKDGNTICPRSSDSKPKDNVLACTLERGEEDDGTLTVSVTLTTSDVWAYHVQEWNCSTTGPPFWASRLRNKASQPRVTIGSEPFNTTNPVLDPQSPQGGLPNHGTSLYIYGPNGQPNPLPSFPSHPDGTQVSTVAGVGTELQGGTDFGSTEWTASYTWSFDETTPLCWVEVDVHSKAWGEGEEYLVHVDKLLLSATLTVTAE